MLKREYNLSDLVDYFKKHQIPSFEEDIDGYTGYFITAASIAGMILAPNPLAALSNFCTGIGAASFRISKLFSWLPDKFKYANKGREKLAIERYRMGSIVYIKLLDIALLEGFRKIVAPEITPILEEVKLDKTTRETLELHTIRIYKFLAIEHFRQDSETGSRLARPITSGYYIKIRHFGKITDFGDEPTKPPRVVVYHRLNVDPFKMLRNCCPTCSSV